MFVMGVIVRISSGKLMELRRQNIYAFECVSVNMNTLHSLDGVMKTVLKKCS